MATLILGKEEESEFLSSSRSFLVFLCCIEKEDRVSNFSVEVEASQCLPTFSNLMSRNKRRNEGKITNFSLLSLLCFLLIIIIIRYDMYRVTHRLLLDYSHVHAVCREERYKL